MTKHRHTILHIEDDLNDALLFKHAWQKAGLDSALQAVGDGDEAIAYLRGSEQFADRGMFPLPALVLLDLRMPRVSGLEVLAWIRKDTRHHRLPVVVLTSSHHEADVQLAYDTGANSYLVKPVDYNTLIHLAKLIHHYWLSLNERPDC